MLCVSGLTKCAARVMNKDNDTDMVTWENAEEMKQAYGGSFGTDGTYGLVGEGKIIITDITQVGNAFEVEGVMEYQVFQYGKYSQLEEPVYAKMKVGGMILRKPSEGADIELTLSFVEWVDEPMDRSDCFFGESLSVVIDYEFKHLTCDLWGMNWLASDSLHDED